MFDSSQHVSTEGKDLGNLVMHAVKHPHCSRRLLCGRGSRSIDIVRYLVEECHGDPRVELHYTGLVRFDTVVNIVVSIACGSGKPHMVKFLVEKCL